MKRSPQRSVRVVTVPRGLEMAECPRCRGISITHHHKVHSTKTGTPVVFRKTRCDACGFSVFNVIWAENGSPVAFGWMTGQETPVAVIQSTDIPVEELR